MKLGSLKRFGLSAQAFHSTLTAFAYSRNLGFQNMQVFAPSITRTASFVPIYGMGHGSHFYPY